MNTFDVYIDCLCRKSSKRIGIFNRIKAYLTRPERIMYYKSLTKPLILNCSVTWISCRSHDNLYKILKLQKRCAHFILDAQKLAGLRISEEKMKKRSSIRSSVKSRSWKISRPSTTSSKGKALQAKGRQSEIRARIAKLEQDETTKRGKKGVERVRAPEYVVAACCYQ